MSGPNKPGGKEHTETAKGGPLLTNAAKKSWGVIKGIGGYISQLVRGTLSATVGPVANEAKAGWGYLEEGGKKVKTTYQKAADRMAAQKNIAKVGGAARLVNETAVSAVGLAPGAIVKGALGLPGRAVDHIMGSVQKGVYAVFGQYDKLPKGEAGKERSGGGEEAHSHA